MTERNQELINDLKSKIMYIITCQMNDEEDFDVLAATMECVKTLEIELNDLEAGKDLYYNLWKRGIETKNSNEKIWNMAQSGYTTGEIAKALDMNESDVVNVVRPGE